jgi:hypothetical protein
VWAGFGASGSHSDGGVRKAAALLAHLLLVHVEVEKRVWREGNLRADATRADGAIVTIWGMIN